MASTTCQLLAIAGLVTGQVPDAERLEPPADARAVRVAARISDQPIVTHDPFGSANAVRSFGFETSEDRDFDRQPDDWMRRRGRDFPQFVTTEIDRRRSHSGEASLRFDVVGGAATYYSPQVRIDSLHTYLFEGYIRTQLLKHDAAIVTVSLLDHERRRVQQFESRPVTGTHEGWVRVRIGPMMPRADVRFAVVACRLVHGANGRDFHGAVWFDDLVLGRTPRLSLESNFHEHFVDQDAPIRIRASVGGIERGVKHELVLALLDANGDVLSTTRREVERPLADADASREPSGDEQLIEAKWELPSPENGFYHVRAVLYRDGEAVLEEATTLAVMDLVEERKSGEFGWAIPSDGSERMDVEQFAGIIAQSGVHWLKQPVWKLATDGDVREAIRAAELFEALRRRNIMAVGLLAEPPRDLRRKFAKNWTGVSEAFTLSPELWGPSLEPVLARYSSYVGHWQLGGDDDSSFVGLERLDATLQAVKTEFDRVGRDSRIGVRWTWDGDLPILPGGGRSFLSILEREPQTAAKLREHLERTAASPVQRWAVLKPIARSRLSLSERASDLVKRMTLAKVGGANGIFAYDVFDGESGLLHPDGSPTPMYLPWRTMATALSGSESLGSLLLPNGSTNHLFAVDGEIVMVLWNDTPEAAIEPVREDFFIGEEAVAVDPWGRVTPLPTDAETHRQSVTVGPEPVIIRGGVEAIARMRMATRLKHGAFDSATGEQAEAVLTRNTFGQGIGGKATLVLAREWKAEPTEWPIQAAAGETIELPTFLELPQNATLGRQPVAIDFEITADRVYRFRVTREIRIGLGDIGLVVLDRRLPNGQLEIEQIITNKTSPVEILDFECNLFVPGYKRRRQLVTKLGQGEDRRFYHLPNADSLKGQRLWLRAQQEGGRRVLNFKWTVGENWDENDDSARRPRSDRIRFE